MVLKPGQSRDWKTSYIKVEGHQTETGAQVCKTALWDLARPRNTNVDELEAPKNPESYVVFADALYSYVNGDDSKLWTFCAI